MSAVESDGPGQGGDDILAAEFVLGVLPSIEQAALSRRTEIDPAFARLVGEWQERLSPLADHYAGADLPPSVKLALDQRLFGGSPAKGRPGFWSSLALWRGLAGVAVLAVMLTLALPHLTQEQDTAPGMVVSSLSAETSEVRYMAIYQPAEGMISLAHVSGAPAEGQVFELWAAEGAAAPVSLGVVPAGGVSRLTLDDPARALLTRASYLAISVEPPGGSPTGQPTGAIVAVGDLQDL